MAILPDLAAMLNNALGSSPSAAPFYSGGIRNAMIFTSTLRQRINNPVVQEISQAARLGLTQADLGVDAADFVAGSTLANRPSIQASVTMGINPNNVTFKQPKRFTKKDTREGSVFFHFTNEQGQNNDVLTIAFKGNTGNIDRRGSLSTADEDAEVFAPTGSGVASADDNGAVAKILAWHNLYLLTREPVVLASTRENVQTITYISALFPRAFNFYGFYNNVLDFEEDARKPNSRNYSFEFTVTSTKPDLDHMIDDVFLALQNALLKPTGNATIVATTP